MHLTDAEVATLAHGEMAEAEGAVAFLHIAKCPECARRFDRFEATDRDVALRLQELDHALPGVTADAVIARATRRPFPMRGALAAGITILVIAGTAAAAVPGSPVRRYLERVFAKPPAPVPMPGPVPVLVPVPTAAAPSGIAFVPASAVDVVFREAQRTGSIRITVSEATILRITHQGGTAGYALIGDGVSVDNQASTASYEITLPGTLVRARILVGHRVVFSTEGARIVTGLAHSSGGSYVLSFTQLASGDR